MVNGFDPAAADHLDAGLRSLVDRRHAVMGPSYRLFYETPVEFVRGEGVWLFDSDGNPYLDAYNNVPIIGHSHPAVHAAVSEALGTLSTHTRYLTHGVVDYAERLVATFGGDMAKVTFACSGSEAVDLAVRLTRYETGHDGFLVTSNAYHGTTTAAANLSPSLGPDNDLGRTVVAVPAPDIVRDGADIGACFAEAVRTGIAELRSRGVGFAGIILDSILSSDGVQSDPAGYLAEAREVVRDAGGLWIADEVQPGFGRTGEHMWGYQRHGIDPDLVVIGKPMGNGYPISAMLTRPGVGEKFGADIRYFNTFGGSGAAIAAASAVLDVLEGDGLMARAAQTGAHLLAGLVALTERHPNLVHARGAGLFIAVECDTAATASTIVNGMRARRVLISASGERGNILKIRPPLAFESIHIPTVVSVFAEAVSDLPTHSTVDPN
ncbi:MAG: hypothetical protein RL431_555 [Actinomycetota bacterium]|jgi:4-aminobutyrate aminotransferase-like enzyme